MKRWIAVFVPLLALAWILVSRFTGDDVTPAIETSTPQHRTVDVADVIEYALLDSPTYRVRTTRDVLPGGLSAAMAPALVVWDDSDFSSDGWITVRNVNHGGNPVSGVTILRTARFHPARVERAEFIMVPLGGPEAISHGQIRFVFADDGAQFVGGVLDAVGEPVALSDLVLSWEAWRPPGVDYEVLKGMDPHVYQLTMRAYSGTQRFLEDALMGRDWNVYTLQLPGGQNGISELLKVSLAMGDGAARHVIGRFLEKAEHEWAEAGPATDRQGGMAQQQWREIRERLGGAKTGGDTRVDMAGRSGYQSRPPD
jgi:hypothetical protein